ncbi:MAG TPA: FAD-dependent oxidoreductase [Bryobacteraceae bacterium]|jgi:3-phenylpropionate/trans-cinnamate dioxygenase ferredoxin reductase subunit
MASGVVIVGAGQAGFQLAVSLRSDGYDGPVILVGDEPFLPYQRPPLSKAYLAGKQDIEAVTLRPESFYVEQGINLLMGETASAIDRTARTVRLSSGSALPYDSLVLATGARNRLLPVVGAGFDNVCYLRTRAEAVNLGERLEAARSLVIIGGGFIGLEVAAAAAMLGKEVTVIEAQARLMARAVAPAMSEFFRALHTRHGVRVVLNGFVREVIGHAGRVSGVAMDGGDAYPADVVVIGIGVVPHVDLAEAAGLPCGNGIIVNEHLKTADDNIYAIGDCAWHPNRYAGCPVRIESVQNAVDQARSVSASIIGRPRPYDAVPWFWTDQFEAKLQMAGLSVGGDLAVTRGDPDTGRFSVCYFKGDRLMAIDSVNRPGDHMAGRKLLAAGARLTPTQAADLNFDLKALL